MSNPSRAQPQPNLATMLGWNATEPAAAKQVLTGDQREKAIKLLGVALSERRVQFVLQLLAKDATLASETVQIRQDDSELASTIGLHFAAASLHCGFAAGYAFAISRGLSPDAPICPGETTLVEYAAALGGEAESTSRWAHLLMLASLGSNLKALDDSPLLHKLCKDSINRGSHQDLNVLIDAGVSFNYPAELLSPVAMALDAKHWDTPVKSASTTKFLARLAKSGVDMSSRTGSHRLPPVQLALELKSFPALIALVRLGSELPVKPDLFELLAKRGLKEQEPALRQALMEAQISKSSKAAGVTPTPAADPLPDDGKVLVGRRRVNIL